MCPPRRVWRRQRWHGRETARRPGAARVVSRRWPAAVRGQHGSPARRPRGQPAAGGPWRYRGLAPRRPGRGRRGPVPTASVRYLRCARCRGDARQGRARGARHRATPRRGRGRPGTAALLPPGTGARARGGSRGDQELQELIREWPDHPADGVEADGQPADQDDRREDRRAVSTLKVEPGPGGRARQDAAYDGGTV